jgi:hypothetical protein
MLSHPEIQDRLDKWFGLRNASYPDAMIQALSLIVHMTPDDRERTVSACNAFFCVHCGGDDPGCQCWNDE